MPPTTFADRPLRCEVSASVRLRWDNPYGERADSHGLFAPAAVPEAI
jgi:hypothetical protein